MDSTKRELIVGERYEMEVDSPGMWAHLEGVFLGVERDDEENEASADVLGVRYFVFDFGRIDMQSDRWTYRRLPATPAVMSGCCAGIARPLVDANQNERRLSGS